MRFNGKVVVITGASSGIGRQLAVDFAKRGAKLALVARRKEKLLETKNMLGNAVSEIFACDVSKSSDVKKISQEIIAKFGAADILINNAGFNVHGEFEKVSIREIENIMGVNYFGAVNCIKSFLPQMLKQGQGRIVNIASVSGLEGVPKSAAYSASKFAMIGLSESLYLELKPKGIHVSVFCPARTKTDFFMNNPSYHGTSYLTGKKKMMSTKFVSKAIIESIHNKKFMAIVPLQARLRLKFKDYLPKTYLLIKEKLLHSRLYKL